MGETGFSDLKGHPIQVVSRRTGLTPDVIRVWERRYGAVSPERSTTNRRLYTDSDVERLLLLRRATLGGRRIGDVAGLSTPRLKALVAEDEAAGALVGSARATPPSPGSDVETHFRACLDAVEKLDGERLERSLSAAAVDLAAPVVLDDLIRPLLQHVGRAWRDGSMRVAHEHLVTGILKSFLAAMRHDNGGSEHRPDVVVATPAGQVHELGALMVAVTASLEGWKVTYLGPDLPAEEIAATVRLRGSRAVLLSIVYPADDPRLGDELRKLGRLLPQEVRVIAGGSSAYGYRAALTEVGAVMADGLRALREELEGLRYRRA